ncbi:MAG: OmpA family protein [Deltaproteobacteria bacterium]|nr:OmpA family protein [Deltaproteobacteria bacterium]
MKKSLFLMFVFLLATLWGCGGVKTLPQETIQAVNPVAEVDSLTREIEKARADQLDVLAPTWFEKAEDSLLKAQRDLQRGEPVADISQMAAYGRVQLRQAEESALIVKSTLGSAIQARSLARKAGAQDLGKDYQKAENDFLELTNAIENNNLDKAQKNKAKVTQEFDQLELRAIKNRFLNEVRSQIELAEKEGAANLAAKTYKVAKESLSEADAFITENRYQDDQIKEQVDRAGFQANRLLQITRQASLYKNLSPEDTALGVERLLYKLAQKTSGDDLRNWSFEMQTELMGERIAAIRQERDEMKAQITEMEFDLEYLETKSQQEQAARKKLAAEKRFNEIFNEVQGYFKPEEAEVYKQGNQLVIRLKAIQFPVGKSFLVPENYVLLSRVQKAIAAFEAPQVVVEGHTDSTGSKDINEKLSKERAEAVEEYLVANRTIDAKNISAVGYGPNRPLAPNETKEGRAINRRIDLIIKPSFVAVSGGK